MKISHHFGVKTGNKFDTCGSTIDDVTIYRVYPKIGHLHGSLVPRAPSTWLQVHTVADEGTSEKCVDIVIKLTHSVIYT